MRRVLRGIDDVSDLALDSILRAAANNPLSGPHDGPSAVLGLAFLESSLRTRVGFAAAAARMGWPFVEVRASRSSRTSRPEPWTETLRVLSGMVDVVVARPGCPLTPDVTARWSVCPVVNGGDTGSDAEHPTQAIIDLFAIEQLVGPVNELTVALCGDLRTRASRSFVRLLARRPPKRLVVVTDSSIDEPSAIPAVLAGLTERRSLPEVDDVDVISVVGLPHGAVATELRQRLQVDRVTMDRLPKHAAVLSPMPVLDEVETAALDHPRVRLYEQSDLGVQVRAAILQEVLAVSQEH